jgi:membrane protein DedA with SNARE-associated domain
VDFFVDLLLSLSGPGPYLIVFAVLLACGLGLPIPEDITLAIGGLMSYYGATDLGAMIAVCMAGVLLGDGFIFFLGRRYGRGLTRVWFFRSFLSEDRLNAVQASFQKRGNIVLFFARFMPGLRAPIFFSAGTLHIPFRTFALCDGGAALLSVPAIVGAVYFFGDEFDAVVRFIRKLEYGILFVALGAAALLLVKWYWGRRRAKRAGV